MSYIQLVVRFLFTEELGKYVVVILDTLLDSSGDAEGIVREAVCKALQKLAKERTNEIVEKICWYKEKKGKVSPC